MKELYYTTHKNDMYRASIPIRYVGAGVWSLVTEENRRVISTKTLTRWIESGQAAEDKKSLNALTIQSISKIICDYFDINVDVLQSKTRKREIVQARQLVHYFCWDKLKLSLTNIGSTVGSKDHATVLHSKRTVDNLRGTNSQFAKWFSDIEELIEDSKYL